MTVKRTVAPTPLAAAPAREAPADPRDTSIHIRSLSKAFRSRSGARVHALQDINLDIAAGSFMSLLGPSGCGKTTLLRLIAGLEAPTSGEIDLCGAPVAGPSQATSMVFQGSVLLPWKTIRNNVLLPAKIRKHDLREWESRADELLERTGLAGFANHYPRELSGGMRQRAAICRAMLLDPPVLLMDEPFGALDAMTRAKMNEDLLDLWLAMKKTVVFVTHDIAEAVRLASTVVVMSPRPGRITGVVDLGFGQASCHERTGSDDFARHLRALEHAVHRTVPEESA